MSLIEVFLNEGVIERCTILQLAKAKGLTKHELLQRLRRRGCTKLAALLQNYPVFSLDDLRVADLLVLNDELSAPPVPAHLLALAERALRQLQAYDQTPKTIGRLIAERRRRLGLTQAELAARAGMSRETLSQIERGQLKGFRRRYDSEKYHRLYLEKLSCIDRALRQYCSSRQGSPARARDASPRR